MNAHHPSPPPSSASPTPDPLIDEVRRVRERLSAEAGNDPKRLVQSLDSLKANHQGRLILLPAARARKSA